MKKKIIYYKDELNDEFSGVTRNTIRIDKNYKYIRKNIFYKLSAFIVYRVLVMPFAFFYMKIKFHMKVKNKKVLKSAKNDSYFMYGNHTQIPGDGFIPNIVNYPKHNAVVVNADNVSLPGTQVLMMMLGATPIPNDFSGMRKFMECISYNVKQKKGVVIYPEAHIWPYYTGIRNFKSDSFKFPYPPAPFGLRTVNVASEPFSPRIRFSASVYPRASTVLRSSPTPRKKTISPG